MKYQKDQLGKDKSLYQIKTLLVETEACLAIIEAMVVS